MYIISKKKDYYDGVVGTMGIDKLIVYDRETKILENEKDFPKEFQQPLSWNRKKNNPFTNIIPYITSKSKMEAIVPFIVGFCGKLYIGWKLYKKEDKGRVPSDPEIIYDFDLIKNEIKLDTWNSNIKDNVEYITSYNPIEIFRTLKVPIFIYDNKFTRRGNSIFIINPNLSEYQFYTLVDSFMAFQEIQMFLGGVLGCGEKEIKEVSDKYKIGQYGFDKWSFRKEPESKK